MAKKPADETAAAETLVKIRLKCTYSGFPGDPGPGDVIEVAAEEAQRLKDLGAAEDTPEAAPASADSSEPKG